MLILLAFGVWMLFFDSNSWLVHYELNQEVDKLNDNVTYYQSEIKKDSTLIDDLDDSTGLERYAREKYFMKRKNEDVYIIDFQDSLKNNNNE